jgi:hypothetical protein
VGHPLLRAGHQHRHLLGRLHEVSAIADELAEESKPESATAIRRAITAITANDHPSDADIARVRARLAAGGWPLAAPDRD